MLGTRFGSAGTRFAILGTRVGFLKRLKINLHIGKIPENLDKNGAQRL